MRRSRKGERVKPRVLMVTGEYPPQRGGVGDYTALLSAELSRLGAEVLVLAGSRAGGSQRYSGEPEPRLLPVLRGWGPRCWLQVASAAASHRCRIVHLQYQAAAFGMSPAVNLLPAFLRLRLRGTRVVTTFHDLRVPYLFPKAGRLRGEAVRALDRFSHASVATNQADLDKLGGPRPGRRDGAPRRRMIPIGSNIAMSPPADFDRRLWRRQVGAGDDTLLLSYFGFMNESKGVEELVKALGLLVGRGVDARLLVVGGETGDSDPTNRAYYHRVGQLIEARRLADRVYWTGFLPADQVSASLLSSDLCALPYRDGASLRRGSLLAALVHGLPVVTTTPGDPEPSLLDGENISLVQPDSPAALADTLERLWANPGERLRLAGGAGQLARRVEWPAIAAQHMELFEDLL